MEQGNRSAEPNVGAFKGTELLAVDNIDSGALIGDSSREKLTNPEMSGEVVVAPATPQSALDDNTKPQVMVPALDLPSPASGVSSNSNPVIAEDNDLIETEWVKRAKEIVAENKKDPYQQGESVAGLKVDYLKKRFGREIGKSA